MGLFGDTPTQAPIQQVENASQRAKRERDELGRSGFEASPMGKAIQFIVSGGGQYNANTQQYEGGLSSMINNSGFDPGSFFADVNEEAGRFGREVAAANPVNRIVGGLTGQNIPGAPPGAGGAQGQDIVAEAAQMTQVADQYIQQFEGEMEMVDRNFRLYDMLDTTQLPANVQQALDEARTAALGEVDRIDQQIKNVESTMHLYDIMMNPENLASPSEVGVATGLDPNNPMANALSHLASRMGMGPGQVATANQEQLYDFAEQGDRMVQGAVDGDVSQEELDEFASEAAAAVAGDSVAGAQTQLAFNLAAQQSVNDLVESRKAIQTEYEGIQSALENEAAAQQDAKFVLGFDPTPQGAYNDAYVDVVSSSLEDQLDMQLSPEQEAALMEQLMPFATYLDTAFDPDSPAAAALDAQLNEIAVATGADKTVLKDAIMNARNTAKRAQAEVEDIPNTKKFKGGSGAMAHLIYQAAEEETGGDIAQALANSPSMHKLLTTVSGGRAGWQSANGSMAGMAGLPREVYKSMNLDYDEIAGDPVEEARALVRYVNVVYGGDAAAALRDFSENQSWGTRVEPMTRES